MAMNTLQKRFFLSMQKHHIVTSMTTFIIFELSHLHSVNVHD